MGIWEKCPATAYFGVRCYEEIYLSFIVNNIQWIMLVSGVLTCTMVYAVFLPEMALKNTFGESPSHPVTNLVVRSWGALITLIGIMLIYAAYEPDSRIIAAIIAGGSKFIWSGLFVLYGRQYLKNGGLIIGLDFSIGLTLYLYLIANSNST
jgi:hypothetical protein